MSNLENKKIEETKEKEIKTIDDLIDKIKDEEEIAVGVLDELSASQVSAGDLLSPRDDVGH